MICFFFFSSRRRHTRCALVTGVHTCALPICSGGIAVIDPEVGITVPTAVPNYTIRAVATIAHGMADVPRMTHCRHVVVGSRDWIRKVTPCRCNLPPPLIVQGAIVPAGSRIGADEIFPGVLCCGARPPAAGSPSIIVNVKAGINGRGHRSHVAGCGSDAVLGYTLK